MHIFEQGDRIAICYSIKSTYACNRRFTFITLTYMQIFLQNMKMQIFIYMKYGNRTRNGEQPNNSGRNTECIISYIFIYEVSSSVSFRHEWWSFTVRLVMTSNFKGGGESKSIKIVYGQPSSNWNQTYIWKYKYRVRNFILNSFILRYFTDAINLKNISEQQIYQKLAEKGVASIVSKPRFYIILAVNNKLKSSLISLCQFYQTQTKCILKL